MQMFDSYMISFLKYFLPVVHLIHTKTIHREQITLLKPALNIKLHILFMLQSLLLFGEEGWSFGGQGLL